MKMKSETEVTQSCLTLSDPMDCSSQGSSIHGICQARALERGAIAFSDTYHKDMYISYTYHHHSQADEHMQQWTSSYISPGTHAC